MWKMREKEIKFFVQLEGVTPLFLSAKKIFLKNKKPKLLEFRLFIWKGNIQYTQVGYCSLGSKPFSLKYIFFTLRTYKKILSKLYAHSILKWVSKSSTISRVNGYCYIQLTQYRYIAVACEYTDPFQLTATPMEYPSLV